MREQLKWNDEEADNSDWMTRSRNCVSGQRWRQLLTSTSRRSRSRLISAEKALSNRD